MERFNNVEFDILATIANNIFLTKALESNESTTDLAMFEDTEMGMKVALVTDALIDKSKLKEVTDPMSFNKDGVPTEGGIFSNEIFGNTADERRRTFGCINLHTKFFHPYVYEIIKFLIPKKFESCAMGLDGWSINKEGILTKDPEGETGLSFLINNFSRLSFDESDSITRSDRVRFIKSLSEDEIFVTKWLIIPVAYRDIDKNSATYKLPALDDEYNKIIRYSNSLRDSTFSFFNNQTEFNIQRLLVDIRKRGQRLLEKKHGFFQKGILGKSIDRGSRDVISTVSLRGYQRPTDNPIDVFTSGFPLAKCLIMGYDYIMKYCLQFFADNFRDMRKYPTYKLVGDKYELAGELKLKDQLAIFNQKYIEKKINRFKNSHETRFEFIELEAEDGSLIPIHLTGQFYPLDKSSPGASSIISRPMTWTDLFYMAAYNTLKDKYVYVTRYPITSYNSIFPTRCFPLSTLDTMNAFIDGVTYRNYPIVNLDKNVVISNLYNDTVTFSNLFLAAIGGDFNGDTTSSKMTYSLEANAEAETIVHSIKNFVDTQGKIFKVLGNEAHLTFYNMTREKPAMGIVTQKDKEELLALKREELTADKIAKLFGFTTKKNTKSFKIDPPRYYPSSRMVLQPGEYNNKELVETNVGKFLFNKLLIEDTVVSIIPNGYINQEMNKKEFGKMLDIIAGALMDEKLPINPNMGDFLRANEFWGLMLSTTFAPSYGLETIIPNKKIQDMKTKLLDDYKGNDLATLVGIENKLVAESAKLLEGTPGKFLFDSGARGSFDNDYKNMAISVGPVADPITGNYEFMKSSYIDGISKQDLPAAANIVVNAEYPKALGTADGGYLIKQLNAVFQTIICDDEGTDCGTTQGLPIKLTSDNIQRYYDQYIITPKGLVLISRDLPKEYLNKNYLLRSPMYCLTDKLCNKCAGERFYKLGIKNLGLTASNLGSSLLNGSMKFRHRMKVELNEVDIDTLLIKVE